MARSIAVTFDYRCPFAYNGNAAVVAALRAGSDIEFRFTAVLARPGAHRGGRAAGVGARARRSGAPACSRCCTASPCATRSPSSSSTRTSRCSRPRHDKGLKLGHEDVLRDAVADGRASTPTRSPRRSRSGRPLKTLAAEHTEAVDKWAVFGVPTYIEGDEAVFVRFMERGRVDDLERMLDLLQWTRLNEFKRTRIAR